MQSPALDLTTRGRNMAVLFGDGAGAAVLSRSEDNGKGILSSHLHSEGAHAEELAILTPGVGKKWVTDLLKENDPRLFQRWANCILHLESDAIKCGLSRDTDFEAN